MAHIDVDEFVALDARPAAAAARAAGSAGSAGSAGDGERRRKKAPASALKSEVHPNSTSLADFADAVFASRPKAVAVRFSPVLFEDCSGADKPWARGSSGTTSTSSSSSSSSSSKASAKTDQSGAAKRSSGLPRMGGALSSNGVHFGHHDGKLLVRTDAVGLFHVQAVSHVEKSWSYKDVFVPHLDRAAVYQFKRSPEVSGVVWDAEKVPFPTYTKSQAAALCHYHQGAERLKETSHRIPFKSKEKKRNAASYAKVSSTVLAAVEKRYKERTRAG